MAKLKNGRVISISLQHEAAQRSGDQLSGRLCVINLPGFDGCAATLVGPFGLGKGIYAANERMADYDIFSMARRTRSSFMATGIYIGLRETSKHELMTIFRTHLWVEELGPSGSR